MTCFRTLQMWLKRRTHSPCQTWYRFFYHFSFDQLFFTRPDTGADKTFFVFSSNVCCFFCIFIPFSLYILSDISILLTFCLFSSANNISDCGEPSRVANSSRWWSSKQQRMNIIVVVSTSEHLNIVMVVWTSEHSLLCRPIIWTLLWWSEHLNIIMVAEHLNIGWCYAIPYTTVEPHFCKRTRPVSG